MLKTLKTYFGYDSFRPLQEEIIQHILARKDALVLMPTGGGKSICYQIPALLMEGTAVVVSPLISLMKDQVEGLKANGILAEAMNSNNTDSQNLSIRHDCRMGHVKLLYISPERLMLELTGLLQEIKVSLFAIDEAHCISQWGHDFRPEYTQLSQLRERFPEVPIVALTATADKTTREDILTQLSLRNPRVFISSFDRPNLSLSVKRDLTEKQKINLILDLAKRHPGESGIVYCQSRKITEKLAQKLRNSLGYDKVEAYHAGLSARERNAVQEGFINDRVPVICATVAFGMGIDKSNVRWVVHYNLPKSIENFYQEIGRAGRDGVDSETVLFYSMQDIILLKMFAKESGQSDLNLEKLDLMQRYATSLVCRRRILLNYFGENTNCQCGNCDVCENPPKQFDGTVLVQKALSALARAGENIGSSTVIDILRGTYSPEVRENHYDQLKTFGAGRDVPAGDWRDYLTQMLQMGFFEVAYTENRHLKITPLGRDVLYKGTPVQLVVIQRETLKERKEKLKRKLGYRSAGLDLPGINSQVVPQEMEDGFLFEKLRELRKHLADEQGYPAYIVLSDKVLHSLALIKPVTVEDFGGISGIGDYKKQKYGEKFVALIREHLK